jgi:NAD(P)-dependent dehydrogenase (short-subunit alcohol dehydrogenase family)
LVGRHGATRAGTGAPTGASSGRLGQCPRYQQLAPDEEDEMSATEMRETNMRTELAGQTVVVIGGTAGIGLSTARRAHEFGADVVVAARHEEPLQRVADELGARTSALDATDPDRLERFFADLGGPVDHLMLTGPGPYYARLADFDFDAAAHDLATHVLLPLRVARESVGRLRPGGCLLFMGGTGGRRTAPGFSLISALTAAGPAMTRNLALELAPVRVNMIAAGFVDTPLSAELLGDGLEARREELRSTLPIRRVVGPEDIAALAVHLMTNTALTGATYDIDGGQQLV